MNSLKFPVRLGRQIQNHQNSTQFENEVPKHFKTRQIIIWNRHWPWNSFQMPKILQLILINSLKFAVEIGQRLQTSTQFENEVPKHSKTHQVHSTSLKTRFQLEKNSKLLFFFVNTSVNIFFFNLMSADLIGFTKSFLIFGFLLRIVQVEGISNSFSFRYRLKVFHVFIFFVAISCFLFPKCSVPDALGSFKILRDPWRFLGTSWSGGGFDGILWRIVVSFRSFFWMCLGILPILNGIFGIPRTGRWFNRIL